MLNAQKLRILIAEDNDEIREILAHALRQEGFPVITAKGGNEGFSILSGQGVDLVITDLRMKDGTGVELIRRIRRIRMSGEQTPRVVVYTGMCDPNGESYLKALGADEVWYKDSSPREIVGRVDQIQRGTRPGL